MSSFMSTSSSKDDLSTLPTSNRNSANSSSGAPGGVSRSGSSNSLQTNGISSSGTDVVKRGILLKRGRGKVYHPWQLRTVIIRSDYKLYYFEQEILKGTITLEGTKVCAIDTETAGNRPYGFEISNIPHTVTCKVNSLILVAGSEVERDDWIHAIELAARFAAKSVDTSYTSFGDIVKQKHASAHPQQPNSYQIKKAKERKIKEIAEDADEDFEDVDLGLDWDQLLIEQSSSTKSSNTAGSQP